ncbi:MAG: hypothetical protein PF501_03990 [Salinisphaera sp.]|jgi:hypothetical protein|nr:hypothetical protein [Salinisphaera sp.]
MKHSLSRTPGPSESFERLAWWFAAFCVSAFLTSLHLVLTKPFALASFDRLVHFTAAEPFQRRVLIPALAAGIEKLMPLNNALVFGLVEMAFWLALLGVAFHCVNSLRIGRSQAMRRALAFTILVPMSLTLIGPDLEVVPGFVLSHGMIDLGNWRAWPGFYYPYDLPAGTFTLLLSVWLFELANRLTRRRLVLFFAVFALATSNRETTVFLIPLTACLFWGRIGWRTLAALLFAQLLVFTAIELPLHWLFENQPNPNRAVAFTQYENHFAGNIALFESPVYVLTFFGSFAGGCLLPILLWWRYLDRRTVSALIGFVLPLVVFAFIVGRLQEHRVFTEAIPLIWLAALQAIAGRIAIDDHTSTNAAGRER